MKVAITKVTAQSEDFLLIEGITEEGEYVSAQGWQSAMRNHYPPDSYWGVDEPPVVKTIDEVDHVVEVAGHLREDVRPREMNEAERMDYWERLLLASVPKSEVLFEA